MDCNCLGCQNLAKRLKKPKRQECVTTESFSKHLDRQDDDDYNGSCIPKPNNINNSYQRDVNTSNLYRTFNIPDRFERSCKCWPLKIRNSLW